MGCCVSRSSGPGSPYGGAPTSSSRAVINPSAAANASNGGNISATGQVQVDGGPLRQQQTTSSSRTRERGQRRRSQRPLDQHIDKPLRRHTWTSKDRTWSKRQLTRERAEFFDTRVTGRPEVWQTLHAALEFLWEPLPASSSNDTSGDGDGDITSAEDDVALATAQTIISAAEISLPTGNLANGVYDALGSYYPLPEWIVCDPSNVVETGSEDNAEADAKHGLDDDMDDTAGEDDDDLDDGDSDRRREEKGKAVVDVREQVAVRARLSENGRDYQVLIYKTDSVRSVSKKIAEQSSLASNKKVRIAYMGKILKENSSLDAQGWNDGHVINALVFNR